MDSLRQMMANIREQSDAIRRMLARDEALWRDVRQFSQSFQKALASVEEMRASSDAIRVFRENIECIGKQQESWAKSIGEKLAKVPERLRKVLEYLFERGWYLGPDLTLPGISLMEKMVDEARHEQIETEMQAWADSRMEAVSEEVGRDFAARQPIIADAFDAHRAGKYTLSVPVLLAQADGMAKEIIGSHLFHGKPVQEFERLMTSLEPFGLDSFLDVSVTPLRSYSSLGKNAKHSIPGSAHGYLNRHEVLHGVSADYPTKANSARLVSLIDYLLGIRLMLDRQKDSANKWREEFAEALATATEGAAPVQSP